MPRLPSPEDNRTAGRMTEGLASFCDLPGCSLWVQADNVAATTIVLPSSRPSEKGQITKVGTLVAGAGPEP